MKVFTIQKNYIVYIITKPHNVKALLFVMFIGGIYFSFLFVSGISLILTFLAVFFYVTHNGSIQDLEHKRYTKPRMCRGKAYGTWFDLSEVVYVSVFQAKMVHTLHSVTYRTFETEEKEYTINLIYDKRKRLQVYSTKDKEYSIELAKHIAHKLGVKQ